MAWLAGDANGVRVFKVFPETVRPANNERPDPVGIRYGSM